MGEKLAESGGENIEAREQSVETSDNPTRRKNAIVGKRDETKKYNYTRSEGYK